MHIKQYICGTLLTVLCIISNVAANPLIVHGRLLPKTDSRRNGIVDWMKSASVRYEIIELGRGQLDPNISNIYKDENGNILSTNTILISFLLNSTGKAPLPVEAILILDNEYWEQFTPQHSYHVLGKDVWRGILPYSPETWAAVLKKTNEELAEIPPADRLPPAEVYALVEKILWEKGAQEQDIYFKMLRRFPFQWVVNACFLQDGKLFDFTVTLNDRGDTLYEIGPKLNNYYKPGEEIDAYFAREHPDRPPYRRYDHP